MPEYLFRGKQDENLLDGCVRANLQLCNDCGHVVTTTEDWLAECGCSRWVKNGSSGNWMRTDK